ncbi:MAG TPA: translation initiation factor IF-2 [Phycisphaerales bacterium]|nr:translation initiation factor IF-2 [Phycisphaerales bacterium]
MANTRVYILAKELGVKSAAIVKKCQDEGLDIRNHMATISVGLAATIREWFSEGENVTTVETAEKVNLEKVRVKRPKRKVAKAEETDLAGETPTEPEGQAAATALEEAEEAILPDEDAAAIIETPRVAPAVAEPPTVEPEAVPAAAPEPQPEPEPEPEPAPIMPAGPMLEKPAPAALTGPQLVRIEAPEPVYEPRHRRRPRPGEAATEPPAPATGEGEGQAKGKRSTTKKKDRTHGRRKEGVAEVEDNSHKGRGKWRQRDIEERRARLDAATGEGLRLRPTRKITTKAERAAAQARPATTTITEPITVKSLAAALGVKITEIITRLMAQGIMATANQMIASDMAEMIALEFETELVVEKRISLEDQITAEFDNRPRSNLKRRPVVAAMLGHVDHGKTSLLDRIRATSVAAGEAGGITQHIGASQVTLDGKTVTFLDTPGHEAFTAMRARGANMTDVVVLTVAADDGIMPQTIEAIAHGKAAGVAIVVALNKIDLPGCDINRIYAQLSEHGLTPTEWGGETEVVKTSAVTGVGVDTLMETLDYVAELLDLKADDAIPATGWVIEAKMSAQQGPLATVLVKEGCLKKGDIVLAGGTYGRIKAMRNSAGRSIKIATSSMPVEIVGLDEVPMAGDRFFCLDDVNQAKQAAEEMRSLQRENALAQRTQVTLDNLFSQIEAGKTQELRLIVKGDVQGSVDVLNKYLTELSTDEVRVSILHAAPGGITEGDVVLAEASNAIIIGFSVSRDESVARLAEAKGVDIRLYNIIYRITEDLREAMSGMLEPEEKEETLGRAVVRTLFKVSRLGTIAGSYVTSGLVAKNAKVRLIRDNIVIRDEMTVESLKHFKDDAREVKAGLECGIKISGFDDFKTDDVLEFYRIIKVARKL